MPVRTVPPDPADEPRTPAPAPVEPAPRVASYRGQVAEQPLTPPSAETTTHEE